MVLALLVLHAQPGASVAESDGDVLHFAKLQWDQVSSVAGRWVYTNRNPGREQMLSDIGEEYRPADRDYYPDVGPDTLYFALDKRSGRFRLEDHTTMVMYSDLAAGRTYTESTTYTWDGEELRVKKTTQMGSERESTTAEILPIEGLNRLRFPTYAFSYDRGRQYIADLLYSEPESVIEIRPKEGKSDVRVATVRALSRVLSVDIDPTRGYAITRIENSRENPPWRRVTELGVQELRPGIWYPASWRTVDRHIPSGVLLSEFTMEAIEIEINEELPDSLFGQSFPLGARVSDRTSGVAYVQAPSAISVDYAYAIKSQLGGGAGEPEETVYPGGRATLAVVVLVAVAAVIVLLLLVRFASSRIQGNTR